MQVYVRYVQVRTESTCTHISLTSHIYAPRPPIRQLLHRIATVSVLILASTSTSITVRTEYGILFLCISIGGVGDCRVCLADTIIRAVEEHSLSFYSQSRIAFLSTTTVYIRKNNGIIDNM